jgi:pSer/pThr/pTyr-binding forkhead associated (FHA) protein
MAKRSDTTLGGQKVWLVLRPGEAQSSVVEVTRDHFVLGRDETCDLTLDDPKVSRHHAAIRLRAGHIPEVQDLDSANGTFVNGVRVRAPVGFAGKRDATATLGDSDLIQCGDTMIVASFIDPAKRLTR